MDRRPGYRFPEDVELAKQAVLIAVIGDQRELFASKTTDPTDRTELALHDAGNGTNDVIAHEMTVPVVADLK
ncbi:hypothetical protein MPEAHAMD_5760 [Methylobacterium frigidaeris]|uniref:Uncharacterized protein n=1 Tax=Methylobacterium frigidaeris TaxID=2038277 RepID=A0AA37HI45_9HYPH|nr:hypothetical protein MPEAHAMD_5760 [Methylobacterium frigidaeris]